jgi:hypothetical protein
MRRDDIQRREKHLQIGFQNDDVSAKATTVKFAIPNSAFNCRASHSTVGSDFNDVEGAA